VKTKTAYREPRKIQAVETSAPDIPERVQPSERIAINFETDKAEPSIGVVSADEIPLDETTVALQNQLAHLKKSEQLQREHARYAALQQMAAPAPTLPAEPEARIALWRQHGLTDDDASFLQANVELVNNPQLCRLASDEAERQGYERNSEGHRAATLEAFHRLQGQQAQTRTATDPAGFFEPTEPTRSPAAPDRAAMYSAPVSRREAGGYREPSARSVRLSVLEQEVARNLGLTDTAYAEGKIRLQALKAKGEIQQ
jgi:hypothetical protein